MKAFSGVLADDMGLGKTLQTLAWLGWLREGAGLGGKGPHPSLVVCPKSVMDNWRTEAERFYPDLRVRLWRREPAEELSAVREAADLIVINYSQLRSLGSAMAGVHWFALRNGGRTTDAVPGRTQASPATAPRLKNKPAAQQGAL